MELDSCPPSFVVNGPTPPVRAAIFSVPHAGRYYPSTLMECARVPFSSLERLEDRSADELVGGLDGHGWTTIVANMARAWVDLNRSEKEVDALMVAGRRPQFFAQPSEKVRGGLGLFPRRLSREGDLWRVRFDWTDLQQRVERDYRPFHRTLKALLDAAHHRFGAALLIDVHSMPPLVGETPAQIVVGDRFGTTLPAWTSNLIGEICRQAGYRVAHNTPYAGGYISERHCRVQDARYAVQIEVDRTLYLDANAEIDRQAVTKLRRLFRIIAEACAERLEQNGGLSLAEAAE